MMKGKAARIGQRAAVRITELLTAMKRIARITVKCTSTITGKPCSNDVVVAISRQHTATCAECRRLKQNAASRQYQHEHQRHYQPDVAVCGDCGQRLIACRCLDRLDEDAYQLAARRFMTR